MIDEERRARLNLELTLLQKPVWTWKDISQFFGYASAKSIEIKKRALALGGKVDFAPHGVQSRYVLKVYETTPEDEIRKRSIELNEGNPTKESNQ